MSDLVVIRPDSDSTYAGEEAIVLQCKRRRRGPRTKETRFDYLLLMRDGRQLWFADRELGSVEEQK